METQAAAEQALQLLFKKLHPLLEDAAHLLVKAASAEEWLRLHRKLQRARGAASEALDTMGENASAELLEVLEGLGANLTPLGEPLQQSLILTQLCLEEAPKDLLPFLPAGAVAGSTWGPRMVAFLARLEDPAFQARRRWESVDPDLGDDVEELD